MGSDLPLSQIAPSLVQPGFSWNFSVPVLAPSPRGARILLGDSNLSEEEQQSSFEGQLFSQREAPPLGSAWHHPGCPWHHGLVLPLCFWGSRNSRSCGHSSLEGQSLAVIRLRWDELDLSWICLGVIESFHGHGESMIPVVTCIREWNLSQI